MISNVTSPFSQIKICLASARNFMLSPTEANTIIETQKSIINDNWNLVCDEAKINEVDKKLLWKRQFLNPFALEV